MTTELWNLIKPPGKQNKVIRKEHVHAVCTKLQEIDLNTELQSPQEIPEDKLYSVLLKAVIQKVIVCLLFFLFAFI